MTGHATTIEMPEWMLSMRGDIHPDLAAHVREISGGMKMIHHKFVVTLSYPDGMFGHVNKLYEQKRKHAEEAYAAGEWERYVFTHERPYRTDALAELLDDGSLTLDATGWKLARDIWIDSENVQENDAFWSDLWSLDGTRQCMTAGEHKALAKLGNLITVWHGLERDEPDELGFSWTTSREVARRFAQRFALQHERGAYIASGKVAAGDAKAYLLSRNEFEIIAYPDTVFDVKITRTRFSKDNR